MVRIGLFLVVLTLVQGCVSVRTNHGYVLERDQSALIAQIGLDTKESILAKYGEPSLIGSFDRNAWYYLNSTDTARAFFRPKTQNRTVIAFYFDEKDNVTETEQFDLADGENVKLVSRVTPSRGRELNVWEQLLSTVGQLPAGIGQEGPVPGQ